MTTTPTSGAAALPEARLFTKKPVTIAAIQWTGHNLREVITFTDGPPDTRTTHAGMAWETYTDLVARDGLKIYTLEGKMLASPGDWIIRGVKGELYPCKPDIFEATYSPAALAARQATAAQQGAAYAALSDAEIDRIVPALEPVSEDFPVEWALWKDRGRIRNELRASHGQAPAQPVVPAFTEAQIASACLSYRHDFGLLGETDRKSMMWIARQWERAFAKEREFAAPAQPAPDEIINMAREQGLPETEIEGVFRVNVDDLGRMFAADRAALAKWGRPAHSGEPVAWLDPWTGAKVTTDYDAYGKHGIPLYTAPQPVEREPLTHAQAKALVLKYGNDPLHLVLQVERAHGIKGDPHGNE